MAHLHALYTSMGTPSDPSAGKGGLPHLPHNYPRFRMFARMLRLLSVEISTTAAALEQGSRDSPHQVTPHQQGGGGSPRGTTTATATASTLGEQLDASLRAVLPFLVNPDVPGLTTSIVTRGDSSGGGGRGGGSDEQLALGLVRSLRVNNNHNQGQEGHPDDHMDIDHETSSTPTSLCPPLALALVSSRHLPLPEDARAALILLCIAWQPTHTGYLEPTTHNSSGGGEGSGGSSGGSSGSGSGGGGGTSATPLTLPLPLTPSSGAPLSSWVRAAGRAKLARARLDAAAALGIAKGLGLGPRLGAGSGINVRSGLGLNLETGSRPRLGDGLGGGAVAVGADGGVGHLADVLMTLEVTSSGGTETSSRLQSILNGTSDVTIDKRGVGSNSGSSSTGNLGGGSGSSSSGDRGGFGNGDGAGGDSGGDINDVGNILSTLLRAVVLVEGDWMVSLVVKVLQHCALLQQVSHPPSPSHSSTLLCPLI